jgi:hypothetical protein
VEASEASESEEADAPSRHLAYLTLALWVERLRGDRWRGADVCSFTAEVVNVGDPARVP